MNLLLLLSAMLSALTGAMAGVRGEAPRQVATASVIAAAEVACEARVAAPTTPIFALPPLTVVAAMPLVRAVVVTGLPQPYASRRRE